MPDEQKAVADTEPGQVTLGHLFLMITLFMPLFGVIDCLRREPSHPFRYAVGIPMGAAAGVLLLCMSWKTGKYLSLRSKGSAKWVQNVAVFSIFALDLAWIITGAAIGFHLDKWLSRYVR